MFAKQSLTLQLWSIIYEQDEIQDSISLERCYDPNMNPECSRCFCRWGMKNRQYFWFDVCADLHSMLIIYYGHSFAFAHWWFSRCPFRLAPVHVPLSHGQPFALANWRISRAHPKLRKRTPDDPMVIRFFLFTGRNRDVHFELRTYTYLRSMGIRLILPTGKSQDVHPELPWSTYNDSMGIHSLFGQRVWPFALG